jgi:hypothetical protein
MENIKDVREALIDVFKNLKDKRIEIDQAKALVTTANSIIHTAMVQLEHSKFTNNDAEIPFLATPKKEIE